MSLLAPIQSLMLKPQSQGLCSQPSAFPFSKFSFPAFTIARGFQIRPGNAAYLGVRAGGFYLRFVRVVHG